MVKNKYKILIIEDDPFLQSMYANKFEIEGFAVCVADDGKKGIRIFQKEKPDIVLLDVLLPEQNGYVVLKAIKSNPETRGIPVILLTNMSQKSDIEEGLALGAAAYLIKAHFMPSEVVAKVKETLGLK